MLHYIKVRLYEGWANTTLSNASTDTVLDNRTINMLSSNPPVVGCGNGCWLLHYECTDELIALDSSTIKLTVNTNQISPKFDGRVYGAVLIVTYNDGSSSQYWINQGNVNLHKNVSVSGIPYPDLDANKTDFNGASGSHSGNLTVAYLAGDINQTDYLYFNPPDAADSPYNLSNPAWDRDTFGIFELGRDVANSMGGNAYNFDLKSFDVSIESGDNYAIFWRGHSDIIPIYDPPYGSPVNPETESYVSPFLAVLKTTD